MSQVTSQPGAAPRRPRSHTALMSFAGVILLVGLVGLGSAFAVNLFKLGVASHENNRLQRQVDTLKAKRDDLRQKLEWANTPEGGEAIVRNQGLVKQGEYAFRVQLVPAAPPAVAPAPAHPRHRALTFWITLAAAFLVGTALLLIIRARRRRRPSGTLTPRRPRRTFTPPVEDV